MPLSTSQYNTLKLTTLCVAALLVVSCGTSNQKAENADQILRLAGIWSLAARITDGVESPVSERFMKLELNPDATFRAKYRGDQSQGWIRAGQGAFSYAPPYLHLYWETGSANTLLVSELEQGRLLVHHGRNMIPLNAQEPDEIFVREKMEKGPKRSPSS